MFLWFLCLICNRGMTYPRNLISLVLYTQGSNHSLSRSLLFNLSLKLWSEKNSNPCFCIYFTILFNYCLIKINFQDTYPWGGCCNWSAHKSTYRTTPILSRLSPPPPANLNCFAPQQQSVKDWTPAMCWTPHASSRPEHQMHGISQQFAISKHLAPESFAGWFPCCLL